MTKGLPDDFLEVCQMVLKDSFYPLEISLKCNRKVRQFRF